MEVERAPAEGINNAPQVDDNSVLIEGWDDTGERVPPPHHGRGCGSLYTTCRNVHVGFFQPDQNNPSSRYSALEGSFRAIQDLIHTVSGQLTDPPAPSCGLINVSREHSEIMCLVSEHESNKSTCTIYSSLL